ncbi:MAG: hypothetical protein HZC40_17775 [Chloroflexi bacterium]|nr:hypothetical protein [Chloroflexota bacterium]
MRPTLKQLGIFTGIGIVSADIAGIISGALAGVPYHWSFIGAVYSTMISEWILPALRQMVLQVEVVQDLAVLIAVVGYAFVLVLLGAVRIENRTERSWL